MPRDILPGFSYSRSAQRYRSDATGKFVSRAEITGLMESQVNGLENRLGALAQAVADGNLAPAYFAEQARTEMRRAHLIERSLGAGGWDRLNSQDYGSVGRRLRDDYARIVNLAQGLTDGTVTLPQAMNRIQGWAGSARVEFLEAQRQRQQASEGMVLIEKRNLSASEHCADCLNFYEQGWQQAGILPVPGTGSVCRERCRCSIVSREVAAESVGEWIGTRRQ